MYNKLATKLGFKPIFNFTGGNMIDQFIQAIHDKHKIRISFYSKDDGQVIVRTCAPMDYGPSRRAAQKNDRFHLWDYESDTRNHTLSLNPEQIQKMEILEEIFDPGEFITWDTKKSVWFVTRDWGMYS
jgi:hypothetical protein